MLRNIRLTLAYDGTNYVGWQVQPNGLSVQAVVMQALKKLMGHDVNLLCAGRTDAGVHAFGQVASFQTETPIPCDGIRKALRRFLPDDVIVHHVCEVPVDFHATFSAKKKRYRYVIYNTRTHNPFLRNYVWHYHAELDAQAMHEAGQVLLGKHDFRSFESRWPNKATSVRTIKELTVVRKDHCPLNFAGQQATLENSSPDLDQGDFIWVEIVADGFLYNMVRSIVGTLMSVGRGRWDIADVKRIVEAQDRSQAGDTALACGLYMVKVDYE
jgi:tRNA pseudouridine38-40 synthase